MLIWVSEMIRQQKFVGTLEDFTIYKRSLHIDEVRNVLPDGIILGGERTSTSQTLGEQSQPISNIVINGDVTDFVFDPHTTHYNLVANHATSSISFTISSAVGVITVNGEVLASGVKSKTIGLQVDKQEYINVTVTELDKVPVNYIFKITRMDNNTALDNIKYTQPFFSCYLNPTNGYLWVKVNNDEPISEAVVFDLKGKKLSSQSGSNVLNFGGCNDGHYILQVESELQVYSTLISVVR